MSFLSAEWRKLVLVNYEIDPFVLESYLPFDTEFDLWNGKCYVSLVGFMFLNTKLLGIKIPFHVNFEEVNLRFYVKRKVGDQWRRGVVFIKEIVPRAALTFVANIIYRENYQTTKMSHCWIENSNSLTVEYRWKTNSRWQLIKVTTKTETLEIQDGSEAEFITEHYWGYAKVTNSKTNEYEVTHPRWRQYKVIDHDISVNFETNYGDNFGFLTSLVPISVMLAEGSKITVESKTTIVKPS